ncbi:DinB family protein [Peribacillus sp. NPDC097295]|uniref:DinB family protein n=1 Tax=Peribacillus sp. NPDC097295 TaxID=3364402 RepID=UPI0038085838
MNKKSIIQEKRNLVEWSRSLKDISNELWVKPFYSGSWGTSEVISHLMYWDKFMMENRITYILRNECIPIINIDVEAMNKEAAEYARAGITKEDLLNQFIFVCEELVNLIGKIPEERFFQPLQGKEHITLSEYLVGMIDHDLKHKIQIEIHINKNNY